MIFHPLLLLPAMRTQWDILPTLRTTRSLVSPLQTCPGPALTVILWECIAVSAPPVSLSGFLGLFVLVKLLLWACAAAFCPPFTSFHGARLRRRPLQGHS